MKFDSKWFGQAKEVIIETTALVSLLLIAAALIVNESDTYFDLVPSTPTARGANVKCAADFSGAARFSGSMGSGGRCR